MIDSSGIVIESLLQDIYTHTYTTNVVMLTPYIVYQSKLWELPSQVLEGEVNHHHQSCVFLSKDQWDLILTPRLYRTQVIIRRYSGVFYVCLVIEKGIQWDSRYQSLLMSGSCFYIWLHCSVCLSWYNFMWQTQPQSQLVSSITSLFIYILTFTLDGKDVDEWRTTRSSDRYGRRGYVGDIHILIPFSCFYTLAGYRLLLTLIPSSKPNNHLSTHIYESPQ